jgi:DNA-binding SARP family transcriptional activator/pimeloyl-ACP methyl ester carboxylesterase
MQFRILGSLEVRVDGGPVALGGPKPRGLLAVLLLHANQPVSAERLAVALWGEEAPAAAVKTIHVHVSRLRRALGEPGLLTTTPAGYRLRVLPGELDAERFAQLSEEAHLALADGRPERAASAARDALSLWRGPALAEFAFEAFAQAEARRLEEERLAALEVRVEADLAVGRHGELVGELQERVAAHPLRERLHGQLMLALYRSGRQSDALQAYRQARDVLVEQLGIEPGSELRALERAILAHDPALDPAPPASPPAQGNGLRIASGPVGQEIRFCAASDGVRLAWARHGTGPPIVKAANWLTHLEFDWESPVWRHWLEGLGERHTLVRYDERGCGLSDREAKELSLDRWVADLETVVDAAGVDRFALLGISQGAATAIAYAVRHPERVDRLVLYGGYARGRARRGEQQRQRQQALITAIRTGWSDPDPTFRHLFTMLFLPEGTPQQMAWYDALQRQSTSAENAVRLYRARGEVDVSELALRVRAKVLVAHARGDRVVPFEEGRILAALLPTAKLLPLESNNHILLPDEPAWTDFLAEVQTFLGAQVRGSSVLSR